MNQYPSIPLSTLLEAPSTATLGTILVQGDSRPGGNPVEEGAAEKPASPFGGFSMLPMVAIFAIFWFVMIGPERKNRKKREAMLAELKKGDEIMTSSGLYAKVITVQEEVVVLQVAEGVRAKYSRSAIQSVIPKDQPAAKETTPAKVS